MITEAFDNQSEAIINPGVKEDAVEVDACIITFSDKIEKYVVENYVTGRLRRFGAQQARRRFI